MRLDLRNAANSLQIEGKGVLPGDPYHLGGVGGVGTRNTRPYIHMGYIPLSNICSEPLTNRDAPPNRLPNTCRGGILTHERRWSSTVASK